MIVTTTAAGTAQRRATKVSTAHVAITGAACQGTSTSALTGATHSGSSTPASMAEAIGTGILAIQRPSAPHRPHRTMSTPQTTNAPSAAAYPPDTAPEEISSAAPGVDQAIATGRRRRRAIAMTTTAIATHRYSRPEAAWSASAPTARRPASTSAKVLAKPTSEATIPDRIGCASPDVVLSTADPVEHEVQQAGVLQRDVLVIAVGHEPH